MNFPKFLSIIWILTLSSFAAAQATTGFHRYGQATARAFGSPYLVAQPNASVYVTNTATGTGATIYSDPLLTIRIPSSSVTTDQNGNYNYYMPLGMCVNESVSYPGSRYSLVNICGNTGSVQTPISVNNGGTGATTASAALTNLGAAASATTVNNHPLTANVVVSASDITTGTLPHAQLPALVSGDIPDNTANTTGTSGGLTGNPSVTVSLLNSLGAVQVNGATVIPSTVTGYLGTLGTSVVLSQGAITAGHCTQWGTDGSLIDAGAACGSGGGGGGLSYSSPTLNFVPVVSNVAGSGTVKNSAISDDGMNTYVTEPFLLTGDYTIQPTATATISNNYNSHSNTSCASLWNGTVATPECLLHYVWIGSGTTPAILDDHYFPSDLPTNTTLYAINQSIAATNSQNYNTPKFKIRGAYWTGSASATEDWDFQGVVGTGANPTDTLTFTHTGSSGSAVVSMPALTLGGTPYIASGTASNTDVSGELSLSAAATVSYTFANTYTSHPECWATPQFDPGSGVRMWVTYTSTTSMTVNFSSSVTGVVSYGCVGRN